MKRSVKKPKVPKVPKLTWVPISPPVEMRLLKHNHSMLGFEFLKVYVLGMSDRNFLEAVIVQSECGLMTIEDESYEDFCQWYVCKDSAPQNRDKTCYWCEQKHNAK